MIVRKRRSNKNLWPPVSLICEGRKCAEKEELNYGLSDRSVSHWAKAHGWGVLYQGHGKFKHLCPICDRLRRVPQSYIDGVINAA